MATYQHGVYNQEQATSLTTPIRSSAALQVIFGTAPVHLADDPTKAANTPKLCYSFAECQAAVGYSDDFKNFTLCQSIDANFRVFNNAPIILVNVLDPGNSKHTKSNEEESCTVMLAGSEVAASEVPHFFSTVRLVLFTLVKVASGLSAVTSCQVGLPFTVW